MIFVTIQQEKQIIKKKVSSRVERLLGIRRNHTHKNDTYDRIVKKLTLDELIFLENHIVDSQQKHSL